MKQKLTNSGVSLPEDIHHLLREAARGAQRARAGTGRVSASAIIIDLITRHRAELESLAATK